MADDASVEGGAVGEWIIWGHVVAKFKDETVRAVIRCRAEESGHDYAGWNGAMDRGVGPAGAGEVNVVNGETVRRRGGDETGDKLRGTRGGDGEGGGHRDIGSVSGRADGFELLGR